MATMCDLANALPNVIGRLLDREALLKRGRFREETMTDIFTGSLAAFTGPELVIQYPPEAQTGGDIDLQFWNVASNTSLFVRLQAKRLSAAGKSKIGHRAYNELLHKPSKTSPYQYQTLAAAPSPWIPLYMFYNHLSVTLDPYFLTAGPRVRGVNLAFASDIAAELSHKVGAASGIPKKVLHHKRLSYLRKHLFGLEAILCPPGDWGGANVPTPDAVAQSIRNRWMATEGLKKPRNQSDELLRRLFLPDRMSVARGLHWLISDGPSVRIDRSIEYPRITFISGRTDDDRTPVISDNVDVSR